MLKSFLIVGSLVFSTLISSGQNQNISQGFVFDGEPYISIDPENSQHMVVSWMSWTLADEIVIKTRTTFNAGLTWSNAISLQHVEPSYTSADASIDFDQNGNVFLSYIDYTGFDVVQLDGGVYTSKSTDGGLSWGTPVEVITNSSDPGKTPFDRPWISIDRSGGPNNGNIYVTTMNTKESTIGYNPYLTVSTDGGNSYEPWRYLDTTGWLAGFFIKQPMPSPALSSNGIFYAAYPSLVFSQNPLAQFILVSSEDGGNSLSHQSIFTSTTSVDDDLAKGGYLLRSNPADNKHLIFLYLNVTFGDIDVFLRESFDAGQNWTDELRLNDDPIGNNRMQDMVWADFDDDGDLVVSWRDRRNANDSIYSTSTEIWGTVRQKDEINFSDNFKISDGPPVPHDTVLNFAGNDFMCIKLVNDTLNAVWGDVRNGKLNIWFQRMDINGVIQSIQLLASEDLFTVNLFPNPVISELTIEAKTLKQITVIDQNGKQVAVFHNSTHSDNLNIDLSSLIKGVYLLQIATNKGIVTKKIIKE